MAVPADDSILIHVHIPKCGGTSFGMALARQFGEHHVDMYADDPHFVYTEEDLAAVARNPNVWSISSHFIRRFPAEIGSRPARYVTFLRHPVQQFASYRNHVCKVFSGIRNARMLACFPPKPDDLTSKEFARWLLSSSPENAPFRSNYTVGFLTEYVERSGESRLQQAKDVLQSFFFVGTTESLQDDFDRLIQALASTGFPAKPDILTVENTSGEFADDTSWLNAGDEVGAQFFAAFAQDLELYRWAAKRSAGNGAFAAVS